MKTYQYRQAQLRGLPMRRVRRRQPAAPTPAPVPPRPRPTPPQAATVPAKGTVRSSTPLAICAAVIGLFIYGVTLIPRPEFTAFDINAYREKLARRPGGESLRSIIARQLGADGLTPKGTAGWLDYEPSSGNLVMSIKDHRGVPVEGADVRAVIRRPQAGQGTQFVLTPDKDKRYSTELKSFGPGTWDISVTAIDPSVPSGSGLIFRVEKNIRVK